MNYYFVTVETEHHGPGHWAIFTDCHSYDRYSIAQAVGLEAKRRGVVLCGEWYAQPIDRFEYDRLSPWSQKLEAN